MPVTGRHSSCRSRPRQLRIRVLVSSEDGPPRGRAARASAIPCTCSRSPIKRAGGRAVPQRRQHHRGSGRDTERVGKHVVQRRRRGVGVALQLEEQPHGVALLVFERIVPARGSSSASSSAVPLCCSVSLPQALGEEQAIRGVHQRSGSEVEQAAGDDVALHLCACRRRSWRPASTGTPPAIPGCARRRRAAAARQPLAARSKTACSAAASRTLSIDVSAPSVSPAAMRYWVCPRTRPKRIQLQGTPRPPIARSAAPRNVREQCTQSLVQESAAVPDRRAALVRQQVHGDRPALVDLAERARRREPRRRRRKPRRTRGSRSSSPAGAP